MGWLDNIEKAQNGITQELVSGTKKEQGISYEEYKRLYDEGNIHNPYLDEVVITANKKTGENILNEFPKYYALTEEEKKYFRDDGPIGSSVRRKAKTSKSFADDIKDIPGQLLQGAGEATQVPQSLLIEGTEALGGNDYNFADVLPGSGKQRYTSDVYGFQNTEDLSWYNPKVVSNFVLDSATDPLDLIGAGYIGDAQKAIKRVSSAMQKKTSSIIKDIPTSSLKTIPEARSIKEVLGTFSGIPTSKSLPRLSPSELKEYRKVQQIGRIQAKGGSKADMIKYALDQNLSDEHLMQVFGETREEATERLRRLTPSRQPNPQGQTRDVEIVTDRVQDPTERASNLSTLRDIWAGQAPPPALLHQSSEQLMNNPINGHAPGTQAHTELAQRITRAREDSGISDLGFRESDRRALQAGTAQRLSESGRLDRTNIIRTSLDDDITNFHDFNDFNVEHYQNFLRNQSKIGRIAYKVGDMAEALDINSYSSFPYYGGPVKSKVPSLMLSDSGTLKNVSKKVANRTAPEDIKSGDVFTGSQNTSHSSYLPQLKQIFNYKDGATQFLGYSPMNDLGFLDNFGYNNQAITKYLNTEIDQQIKRKKIPKNVQRPFTKNTGVMLPHYGIKQYQEGGTLNAQNGHIVDESPGKPPHPSEFMPISNKSSVTMGDLIPYPDDDRQHIPIKLKDNRKIRATTGKPMREKSDYISDDYDLGTMHNVITYARQKGLSKDDLWNLISMDMQETGWGNNSDGQTGHVLGNWGGNTPDEEFVNAYIAKMKIADGFGLKGARRLQIYNGDNRLTPKTESWYYGKPNNSWYGVPIPKEGFIDLKKNPLYGKQIIDIRDNVLKKNKDIVKHIDSAYAAPVPRYIESDNTLNAWEEGLKLEHEKKQTEQEEVLLDFMKLTEQPTSKKKETKELRPDGLVKPIARLVGPHPDDGRVKPIAFPIVPHPDDGNKKLKNGGWLDSYEDGGVIEDDRGQWAHPGKITKINSNKITMKGVDYPVLGVSDTGDKQLMQPGQEYSFKGDSVTEYPIMENGGWLDSYQDGGTVSQVWEQKTGSSWGSAKQQGLTDGSYANNMKLLNDLNSGKYDAAPLPQGITPIDDISAPVLGPEPEVKETLPAPTNFNEAFKQARETLGANRIFEFEGRKYGTNLAGEIFTPSKAELAKFDMDNTQTRVRLKEENERVKSPVSDKNTVKLEPEDKSWDAIKEKKKDINKMSQTNVIIKARQESGKKGNYIVIDKVKGLAHVYSNDSKEPIYSTAIDVGKTESDAQTVTKIDREKADTNKDGIVDEKEASVAKADFSKGNKSTGAGKYILSNISETGYKGMPLLNLVNEAGQEVATAFHNGFRDDGNARVSNGCLRCSPKSLGFLAENMKSGEEVYILPEDEENAFVYENGKLNFNSQSKKDYDTYVDSRGVKRKGQGVNRTRETLNYQPISIAFNEEQFKEEKFHWGDFSDTKEMNNTVKPFIETLQSSKRDTMKLAKVNGDVYNDIAEVAFGIFGVESGYGDTNTKLANAFIGLKKKMIPGGGAPDTQFESNWRKDEKDRGWNSLGLTQVVWNQLSKQEKTKLKTIGITSIDDFNDPKKAAQGTVLVLALRYNNEIKGKKEGDLQSLMSKTWNKGEDYDKRVKDAKRFITLNQLD